MASPVMNLSNSDDDLSGCTLIGKVLSAKIINFTAINAILTSSWTLGTNVRITMLGPNTISCWFKYEVDCTRILEANPWAIKGYVLNLI